MQSQSSHPNRLRLGTPKSIPDTPGYGCFTESGIRHLINESGEQLNSEGKRVAGNGFERAIIRIGRRILIDLDEMDNWLRDHRQGSLEEATYCLPGSPSRANTRVRRNIRGSPT